MDPVVAKPETLFAARRRVGLTIHRDAEVLTHIRLLAHQADNDLMLKLNNIMIGTSDPKAMADFYGTVFGRPADLIEADEWFSWNTSEKMSLSIGPHSEVTGQAKEPQRIILNMETPEVREEFARIKKAPGATVVKEPYEMGGAWIATLADPEGNYFQLVSPMEPERALASE